MMTSAATMAHREIPVLRNRLSQLMGARRVNIREVAEGSALSYRVVLDLYHDRSTRMDVATLGKLCDYFGVGPEQIFEWIPPTAAPDGETGVGR